MKYPSYIGVNAYQISHTRSWCLFCALHGDVLASPALPLSRSRSLLATRYSLLATHYSLLATHTQIGARKDYWIWLLCKRKIEAGTVNRFSTTLCLTI